MFRDEQFAKAIPEFQQAIKFDPLLTIAHYELGQTFMALRQYREAQQGLPPVRLEDGGQVPYLGLTLPIRVHVEPWRTRAGSSRCS